MSISRTPSKSALWGALGAELRWGRTIDRTAATQPAREAFKSKWERQVRAEFPDASDEQVERMAEHRRRAHYLQMAAKSVASRQRRAARRSSSTTTP